MNRPPPPLVLRIDQQAVFNLFASEHPGIKIRAQKRCDCGNPMLTHDNDGTCSTVVFILDKGNGRISNIPVRGTYEFFYAVLCASARWIETGVWPRKVFVV